MKGRIRVHVALLCVIAVFIGGCASIRCGEKVSPLAEKAVIKLDKYEKSNWNLPPGQCHISNSEFIAIDSVLQEQARKMSAFLALTMSAIFINEMNKEGAFFQQIDLGALIIAELKSQLRPAHMIELSRDNAKSARNILILQPYANIFFYPDKTAYIKMVLDVNLYSPAGEKLWCNLFSSLASDARTLGGENGWGSTNNTALQEFTNRSINAIVTDLLNWFSYNH